MRKFMRNAAAGLLFLVNAACSDGRSPVYLQVESDGPWAGTIRLGRETGGAQTEHTGNAELRLDELGPIVCWRFSMRGETTYIRTRLVQGDTPLPFDSTPDAQQETKPSTPWVAGCWERG